MINNNKKKDRKSSQEIGIEIKEIEQKEKLLDRIIEEKKKILRLEITKLENDTRKLETTKRDIIIYVGEFIERQKIYDSPLICAKLKNKFKGYINQARIYQVCDTEKKHWLNKNHQAYGHKGRNQYDSESLAMKEELTQQDLDYIKAYDDEVKRNKQLADLIESLTGLTIQQQGQIILSTKKGEDFRKKLVDASHDYMLKTAKQMIRSDIRIMLADLRTVRYLTDEFGDLLYEEEETRKAKEHLESV
jgi:hypothetical protein